MKYTWTYSIGTLEDSDKEYFERMNPGFTATGETLEEEYREEQGRDGGGMTYAVMKANRRGWTPFGMCRDCGDHYIIARYSRYDRVDKGTLKLTKDVDDK